MQMGIMMRKSFYCIKGMEKSIMKNTECGEVAVGTSPLYNGLIIEPVPLRCCSVFIHQIYTGGNNGK